VGHHATEFQVAALRVALRKALDVLQRDTDAIHPCVDFQVKRELFAAVSSGGAFELLELVAAVNDRSEVVFEERGFFAGPEAGENQNRLANASLANLDAFGGGSDAEPVGASFFKDFCDLRAAMTVTVALDYRQDQARSLA